MFPRQTKRTETEVPGIPEDGGMVVGSHGLAGGVRARSFGLDWCRGRRVDRLRVGRRSRRWLLAVHRESSLRVTSRMQHSSISSTCLSGPTNWPAPYRPSSGTFRTSRASRFRGPVSRRARQELPDLRSVARRAVEARCGVCRRRFRVRPRFSARTRAVTFLPGSQWTKPPERRGPRAQGPARRHERAVAKLFAQVATQSEASEGQNVYYT